jgi:hypothetical protein
LSITCGGIGTCTGLWSLQALQAYTGRTVRRRINRAGMRSSRSEDSSLDKALLTAAVAAGLVSGLQALFHHFEVIGQGPAHRLLGCALLDVGHDDDILGRGRLRVFEHFVDQRQLAILDRQLLGARAEEAVFEVLDAEFEQALFTAPLFTELPQQSDGLFEARGLGIRGSQHCRNHSNNAAKNLAQRPVFTGDYGFSWRRKRSWFHLGFDSFPVR